MVQEELKTRLEKRFATQPDTPFICMARTSSYILRYTDELEQAITNTRYALHIYGKDKQPYALLRSKWPQAIGTIAKSGGKPNPDFA